MMLSVRRRPKPNLQASDRKQLQRLLIKNTQKLAPGPGICSLEHNRQCALNR